MARPKTTQGPTSAEIKDGYITPAILLYFAAYAFLQTLAKTIFVERNYAGIQQLRDDAFSKFWLFLSSQRTPEDESELVGSAALEPPLLRQASGDVLEIGPGTGTSLRYVKPSQITSYTLAEPAKGLHEELERNTSAAGLGSKPLNILPCGAAPQQLLPALDKAGLLSPTLSSKKRHTDSADRDEEGVFDTIICMRVLCSVSDQKETLGMLRHLLRPGGRLLVLEHVKNPWRGPWGSKRARLLQLFYTLLGWSFFVGDCDLQRDTEARIREVGEWDGTLALSQWWGCLPYISGALIKKA